MPRGFMKKLPAKFSAEMSPSTMLLKTLQTFINQLEMCQVAIAKCLPVVFTPRLAG